MPQSLAPDQTQLDEFGHDKRILHLHEIHVPAVITLINDSCSGSGQNKTFKLLFVTLRAPLDGCSQAPSDTSLTAFAMIVLRLEEIHEDM